MPKRFSTWRSFLANSHPTRALNFVSSLLIIRIGLRKTLQILFLANSVTAELLKNSGRIAVAVRQHKKCSTVKIIYRSFLEVSGNDFVKSIKQVWKMPLSNLVEWESFLSVDLCSKVLQLAVWNYLACHSKMPVFNFIMNSLHYYRFSCGDWHILKRFSFTSKRTLISQQ